MTFFEEKNKRLSKKKGLVSEDIYWEKKKDYYKQKIVVSEDILLRWKKILGRWWVRTSLNKKQKAIKEKWSSEWGHLLREKKDCNKQNIVVSKDTLLGWKKIFGISEWRDPLKGKTKDYKRRKSWWGRTSTERKKNCYKQKIMLREDKLLKGKKFLENSEWGHSLKIKTKGYKRKKVWSVRTSIEKNKANT